MQTSWSLTMVYDDVIKNRRDLITVWLDYKKAFDSVPHSWIIESLKQAKIPDEIIEIIKMLMCKWRTKIHLYGETDSIETSEVEYYKGIIQGDMLSLLLFIFSVNPLSFILHKEEGYKLGKETEQGEHKQETEKTRTNLSHLFFVDDIKLYARTFKIMRTLLEIVTQFSHDVRMKFGEDKCAYQCIKRGKRSEIGEPIKVNNLTITEIE